jgi:DNA/RNA endonuclease G (NUC1)
LSYDEEHAEWVAYELKSSYLKNNDFKGLILYKDNMVSSGSADWSYKKSGFDRVIYVPAADMEFNVNAYNETFLTSNSAQDHDFNAGIWNRLGQKIRFWADKYTMPMLLLEGFGAIPKDNRQRSSCSAKILQNCFVANRGSLQNDCFFNT